MSTWQMTNNKGNSSRQNNNMISRFMRRPFKLIKNLVEKQGMNDNTKSSKVAVGLGLLLTQISQGKKSSTLVVKPALRLRIKPTVTVAGRSSRPPDQQHSCFLKACHLCNKGLSLDKEVYMYRGDIGFCSIVCRDRQIVIDEMRDLEASTKKMLAAYRRRSCTSKVLDDVHQQHERVPSRRTIFAL